MADKKYNDEPVLSRTVRAGRRTYFLDVHSTKAEDYYLTITESKKFTNDDGSFHFKKHKIYLYKEDFQDFADTLQEVMDFVITEKGEEVISDRHQTDYKQQVAESDQAAEPNHPGSFTNVEFEDL